MTTNTKEYIASLKKHQQTILNTASKIINNSVTEMFEKIVERTPVGDPSLWSYPAPRDYNPGTLKASWGITYNTNNSIRGSGGKFTSLVGGGLKLGVNSASTPNAVIYNNQPYAYRVEYGSWSTQAPQGMMRITIMEYSSILSKNAQKYKL